MDPSAAKNRKVIPKKATIAIIKKKAPITKAESSLPSYSFILDKPFVIPVFIRGVGYSFPNTISAINMVL